jgi:hypothetical protein
MYIHWKKRYIRLFADQIIVVRDGATKKLVLRILVEFSRWLSLRVSLRALLCCRVDYFKRSLSMQRWHLPGLRLASCGRPRHHYMMMVLEHSELAYFNLIAIRHG